MVTRRTELDSHENLFIADQAGGQVLEVPADGGATITRASGLDQPSGVVVDDAENLYVSEYTGRVLKYPAGGGAAITLATLPKAYEMAIDDAGTLYVPSVDNSNAIYTVKTDGSGHSLFSSAIESPTGVALGADGYLYVTDYAAGTLSRMPLTDGSAVEVVASQLSYPTGIDFGSDGNLYLAEAGADRIVSFEEGQGAGTVVTSGLSFPWGVAAAGEASSLLPQTVAFTSTAPAPAAIGGTYEPTATGGASGNPVVFSVDPATTNSACTVNAGVVTFAHAGTCVVAADQAGDAVHAAAETVTQSITVAKDAQAVAFTSTAPDQASIGGTYEPTATGGASSNPVVFSVDPATTNVIEGVVRPRRRPLGPALRRVAGRLRAPRAVVPPTRPVTPTAGHSLDQDRVTFTDTGVCTITATQTGGPDHSDASPMTQAVTVVRSQPTITAHLTSRRPETRFGWYRRTVTVTYTCDADGSTIRGGCPAPATVRGSGEHRSRTRTIHTADGGVGTVTTVVDLDKVRPQVRATHVRADRSYRVVPEVGCKASDSLSGVRRCRVRQWVVDHGTRLRYRVAAVDKAGQARGQGGVRPAQDHSPVCSLTARSLTGASGRRSGAVVLKAESMLSAMQKKSRSRLSIWLSWAGSCWWPRST